MKKILIGLCVFGVFRPHTHAQNSNNSNIFIQSIITANQGKDSNQQIINYQNYLKKIPTMSSLDNKTKQAIQNYLNLKIKDLKTQVGNTTNKQTSPNIKNIDWNKVTKTRVDRHNQERTTKKLSGYNYNTQLEQTAFSRANNLSNLGKSTHQRTAQDGYYSYTNINNRFAEQGVQFKETGGTLFSESIGRGYYSCNKTDCTDTFIKTIKSSFNFFMSEKNKSRQPHYKGIIAKTFSDIGLGVSIDPKTNKYFLVTHYSVRTN